MNRIILILMIVFVSFGFVGCCEEESSVVRIHIRANSNCEEDQSIKLKVRDSVIDYITPIIADCNNAIEVKYVLENNINYIESVANEVLNDNGFEYVSKAQIRNEYFPSRDYDGHTFPANYYDALIINLGSGVGDNWWCVAYPPLCFVGEEGDGNAVKYKSKILELINKYFG